ncbi:hypothetical protein D9Q98_009023 [Chlorella vulgaris]|uniref:SAM-dependent methyltransferase n=1 Tax=Chlorella vulgaris TaxID=3077 RepID=A0A9D4TH46_CHLVU|nr:hypothetical protein D9Q98_009023 [Chlorella vulgaris]
MAGLPRSLDSHNTDGQRSIAAAAERNKEAILHVLQTHLGTAPGGLFLEVASGTGQHCAHFAAGLPHLIFQPTEHCPDDATLSSIVAWTRELPNVRPPIALDASQPGSWGLEAASCRAVFVANMCHISPWEATTGLMAGAGHVLAPGGQLFTYGPFSVDGAPTTPSNVAFDASLRQRNPAWGYRDVADVAAEAAKAGLELVHRHDMPANNLLLVFRKKE